MTDGRWYGAGEGRGRKKKPRCEKMGKWWINFVRAALTSPRLNGPRARLLSLHVDGASRSHPPTARLRFFFFFIARSRRSICNRDLCPCLGPRAGSDLGKTLGRHGRVKGTRRERTASWHRPSTDARRKARSGARSLLGWLLRVYYGVGLVAPRPKSSEALRQTRGTAESTKTSSVRKGPIGIACIAI